jgi:hypothetical protein
MEVELQPEEWECTLWPSTCSVEGGKDEVLCTTDY